MPTVAALEGASSVRRVIAFACGWLVAVVTLFVLAMILPALKEFAAWVPDAVFIVEIVKLILFGLGLWLLRSWQRFTAGDAFFVGLGLAVSSPFGTSLAPFVAQGLALVGVSDSTAYFVVLNVVFCLLQAGIVFALAHLRKRDAERGP